MLYARFMRSVALVVATLGPCVGSYAANDPERLQEEATHTVETDLEEEAVPGQQGKEEQRRWFLLLAAVNVHPRLESEQLVRRYLDSTMKALAPGYRQVKTFSDMRDDYLMWPPYVGIGRTAKYWSLFFQTGYSAGKVRTKQNNMSVFLLPIHTDYEVTRGAAYFGFGIDYLPLRSAALREYEGIKDRLKNAKPYIGARVTWTYATYHAKVKVGPRPVGNLVNIELSDHWFIPSLNLDIGVDIPCGKRSVFSFNAGQNMFKRRDFDFGGPSYACAWKIYFR